VTEKTEKSKKKGKEKEEQVAIQRLFLRAA